MVDAQKGRRCYPIAGSVYQRVLGTLHPSCTLPDDGLEEGDQFQLREQSSGDRETGNAMWVTIVRIQRSGRAKSHPVCRVEFAVNAIVRA